MPFKRKKLNDKQQKVIDDLATTPDFNLGVRVEIDCYRAFHLLFEKGLSYADTATLLKVNSTTLFKKMQPMVKFAMASEGAEVYEKRKADLLLKAEWVLLQAAVDADKIERASLNNVGYVLRQISDIRTRDAGNPTQINASTLYVSISNDVTKINQDIEELKASAIDMKDD